VYTSSSILVLIIYCYRKTKPDVPPKYNEIDGKVDRQSFCGKYTIEDNGVPR